MARGQREDGYGDQSTTNYLLGIAPRRFKSGCQPEAGFSVSPCWGWGGGWMVVLNMFRIVVHQLGHRLF